MPSDVSTTVLGRLGVAGFDDDDGDAVFIQSVAVSSDEGCLISWSSSMSSKMSSTSTVSSAPAAIVEFGIRVAMLQLITGVESASVWSAAGAVVGLMLAVPRTTFSYLCATCSSRRGMRLSSGLVAGMMASELGQNTPAQNKCIIASANVLAYVEWDHLGVSAWEATALQVATLT